MTLCYAPILIILNERFATRIRSTGTAIAWNLGYALGGSTTVLVSLFSHTARDLPFALAIATSILSLCYLAAVLLLGTSNQRMEDEG